MSSGKLTYFDLAGRAESIRIALSLAGCQHEDERLSFPQFGEMKAAGRFPMGSAPIWTEPDGEIFVGSGPILRMVGNRFGMFSRDP